MTVPITLTSPPAALPAKQRIRQAFDRAAATYDAAADVQREVCDRLAICFQQAGIDLDPEAILDAGCGTGLAGIALRNAGFVQVDGFDIAPAMTEKAEQTGAYRRLLADIDLNADDPGLGEFAETYDIVTCAGVFTLGHVAPEGLRHLFSLARPGGFVIVSTREDYLKKTDFRGHAKHVEEGGQAALVVTLPEAGYVGDDQADYWVFRKLPAQK